MEVWRALRRRFAGTHSAADDVERELRAHLEQDVEDRVESGWKGPEAERAARLLIGNTTRVREQVHEMSPWISLERLMQDVRYGLRSMRHSPAFALTAVLSLALGIGANTAIFTLINAAILRPLPVRDPAGLVLVKQADNMFSYPEYLLLRRGSQLVSPLMAASSVRPLDVGIGSETDLANLKMVSANYFEGLGVGASLGRMFGSTEDNELVAVISHGYWTRRFGASRGVLGQAIRVSGMPFTIVGVAPEGFSSEAPGDAPDLWTTVAFLPAGMRDERGFTWLYLMGRLKPGTTITQVRAEMDGLRARANAERRLEAGSPDASRIEVLPGARGTSGLRDRFAGLLWVLMAIVGLVLLIACTNLGSLLLTRGAARQPEIAMRVALGAGRGRIVRQLLTESLLLAAIGGTAGLVFAGWGSAALVDMVGAASRPLSLDLGPDPRVLMFTATVSVIAGMIFGLAPAFRAVRQSANVASLARAVVGRERRWSTRDAFIVVQMALSIVLLAAGTMFVRTLRNLQAQDLGFRAENLLVLSILSERGHEPAQAALLPQLLARVEAMPGVTSATTALFPTVSDDGGGVRGIQLLGGGPEIPPQERSSANWVGPNYFRTAGIPLIAGRDFSLADNAQTQRVAIVNDTWARHYLAGGQVIGRRFTFNKDEYEIVGVSKDAKHQNLREATPQAIFFALLQRTRGLGTLEVRTANTLASVVPSIRAAVRELDPQLSIGAVTTTTRLLDRKLIRERLVADLAGFFGGLTLLLASIGIYGTLAYAAARRTKEIALRLALGARRGSVVWSVLRDVIALVGVGVAIGIGGVLAVGRLVGSLLYGLGPTDVLTIAIAALLLTSSALVAGSVPALRASRLDPARVLKE